MSKRLVANEPTGKGMVEITDPTGHLWITSEGELHVLLDFVEAGILAKVLKSGFVVGTCGFDLGVEVT